MCSFTIAYTDGTKLNFEHITRVDYTRAGQSTSITAENMLSCHYPIGCTLHLFSENSNYSVSGNGLLYIEAKSE